MNNFPLLSIIVPVYNSKQNLNRCLESIRKQTYQNFEVLIINDGSSDGSEEICKKFELQDSRFRLISQNNRGSAAARNTGLKNSKGELIGFVDSDDYINTEMYEKLFVRMEETGADISICDISFRGEPEHPSWNDETFLDKESIFSEFVRGRVINRVYNKLYRSNVVAGLLFPEGRNMMEDASWTPRVLENASVLSRIAEPLYFYTDNESGISKSKNSKTKICSRFANILDRERTCFKIINNNTDKRLISEETLKYISEMLESYVDLHTFEIWDNLKKLVADNYDYLFAYASRPIEKKMLNEILELDMKSAQSNYRRRVILSDGSIRHKAKLVKQKIESII